MAANRRPTLVDVARAAGVSRSTASYAFGQPDRVSAHARDRVLAAAEALGYAGPDPTAASLRRGRANAIGLLFTDKLSYAFADPAAALFLQGVASEIERADMALTLLPLPQGSTGALAAVRSSHIDGVLAYALSKDHPALALLAARQLPIVGVDMPASGDGSSVGIDDHAGARLAAEHVLSLGHTRLAILADRLSEHSGPAFADAGSRHGATYPVAANRLAGYAAAISEHGLDFDAVPVFDCGGNRVPDGERAADAVLRLTPRPTAVLAMSDQLARGALCAARRIDLRVPQDLSVTGFDDVPAEGTPQLTTVHQDHSRKGVQAARLLLHEPYGKHISLPAHLVTGGSTAPSTA